MIKEPLVDEDAETAEEEAPETPRRRVGLSLPVAIGLSVLLLAALSGAVTFGLLLKARPTSTPRRARALGAARSFAVTLTTYEYSGGSTTLRQLLHQAKATSQGTVIDAGVKSATTDRVEIVLVANQVVTNAAIKEGQTRLDRSRFLMTLEKHDNRWLVSNVRML